MQAVDSTRDMTTPTIQSILEVWCPRLLDAGVESARLDAEVLFAHALETSREQLWMQPDRILSSEEIASFEKLAKRRIQREPLAYLVGYREFWSLDFKVTPDVLIPRPETEVLIEIFLKTVKSSSPKEELRVLDLGTGSGIIATVVAKELKNAQVIALDISDSALAIAKENTLRHEVADRVQCQKSDWFNDLDPSLSPFDFILGNPPYIPADQELMPEIAHFEPRLALQGGTDGMGFYRVIMADGRSWLKDEGALFLEIGDSQGPDLLKYCNEHSLFGESAIHKDYSGRDRVIILKEPLRG